MPQYILTEEQLSVIKNNLVMEKAESTWQTMSLEEKEFVLEFFKTFQPEKSMLIKEASWYNTLGDLAGLVDPTGLVDLANGLSYWNQGDKFFAFLSFVSAVPYIGDVIAKPIMGAAKVGAPSAKALKEVLALSQAGNTVKAAQELKALTSSGGIVSKFVKGVASVAGKLKEILKNAKLPFFGGIRKTVIQWIELFEQAAISGKSVRAAGESLAKALPTLSKEQQILKLKDLITASKKSGVFKTYTSSPGVFAWKHLFAGLPQVASNRATRALMRQTKWWAGFLDYMGYGNFVGPEEVGSEIGEEEMTKKMEEYNKTPQAQQNFNADYGQALQNQPDPQQTQQLQTQKQDPFSNMFGSILGFS